MNKFRWYSRIGRQKYSHNKQLRNMISLVLEWCQGTTKTNMILDKLKQQTNWTSVQKYA